MRQVDTREPWELRERLIQTGWEQDTLYSGDFRFTAHDSTAVGVTRKTHVDLLASVGETFAQQLEEMLTEYPICIFLLEHSPEVIWNRQDDTLMTGNARRPRLSVANWLHRFLAKGFILERTNSLAHTASRLNELYALYQKPYSKSANSRRFADERLNALPSGVRGKIGEGLLERHSLRELANMTLEQLESEDGIGSERAYRIFKHFNRR